MRVFLFLAASSLMLALPVAAQDDGCLEASPCPLQVNVDDQGIWSVSVDNITVGDWYLITVSNDDPDAAHTVTLEGHRCAAARRQDGRCALRQDRHVPTH